MQAKFLSTTSTGIDWVDANTVPGSGLWLANGNNIYNSNSGNVGIGTSSPEDKLEVSGGSLKIKTVASATLAPSIKLGRSDQANGNYENHISSQTGSGASQCKIEFKVCDTSATGRTTLLSLDGGNNRSIFQGNVGIGTTSPGNSILSAHFNESYGLYGPTKGVDVVNENTSGEAGFITVSARYNNTSPAQLYYRAGAIGGGKETATGDNQWGGYLSFWTTSDGTAGAASGMFEHMRITADGNVGIGTTSPNFKLDVGGTLGVSDLPFNASSTSVLVANETLSAELVTNGDFDTNTNWANQSGTNWSISGGKASVSNSASVRYFQQSGVLPNPSVNKSFLIKWTISGLTQGGIGINVGGYITTTIQTSNGTYEQEVTPTNASSNTILYLQSNANTIGSVDNVSVKEITSASTQIQKRSLGSGAFSDELWAVTPTDSNNIYNLNSGNVGIGEDTPNCKLDVKGAVNTTVIAATTLGDGGGAANRGLAIRTDTDGGEIATVGTGTNMYLNTANNLYLQNASNTKVTMLANGNVGIGVTSPNAKLSLAGGSNINSQNSILYIDTNSYYATAADRYITTSTAARYIQLNGSHIWSNAPSGTAGNAISFTERMRITSGGTIGINKTNASEIYQVDIKRDMTDPDTAGYAMRIDTNMSGTKSAATDITQGALFLDTDSTAIGTTADEHRVMGINNDVRYSGLPDAVYGTQSRVESNSTQTGQTTTVSSAYNLAQSDGGANHTVSHLSGTYNLVQLQDNSAVTTTYGTRSLVQTNANKASNSGIMYGSYVELDLDSTNNINYGGLHGYRAVIDNNQALASELSSTYLFRGQYNGVRTDGDCWGLYVDGDKHYLEGNVGIGATSPGDKLEIGNLTNYTGLTVKGAGASRPAVTFKNVSQSLLGAIYGTENRGMIIETGGDGTNGTVALTLSSAGALKLNTYTAGTLVSDASGNITVSSGGGAGGPFLPLAGNTVANAMTGDINIGDNLGINWYSSTNAYADITLGTDFVINVGKSNADLKLINSSNDIKIQTTSGSSDIYIQAAGDILIDDYIVHNGDTNSYFGFGAADEYKVILNNSTKIAADASSAYLYFEGLQVLKTYGDSSTTSGVTVPLGRLYSFDTDTDTGMFSDLANHIVFLAGNNNILRLESTTSTFSSGGGANGDCIVVIAADTDNTVENSNPILKLQQDGGGAFGHFGLNGDANITFSGATVNSAYVRASTDLQFVAGSTVLAATILANGRFGIGTTTATEVLEVQGAAANISISNTSENDSGLIFKDAQDPTGQAAAIKFGSGDNKLKFYVNDVAAQRMVIDTAGNVGIGETDPDVKFHVTANEDGSGIDKGSAKFINTNTGQGATTMHMVQTSSSNFANAVKFWQGSTPTAVGFIRLTTSATQFITSASDLNLKKNITNWSDDTLSKFKALEPKKFRFKTQDVSEDKTLGFIAQNEVDNFPEAYPQFLGDDEKPYYGFNPTGMVPHLMKAIKDLVEKVETLENKITQLENNN